MPTELFIKKKSMSRISWVKLKVQWLGLKWNSTSENKSGAAVIQFVTWKQSESVPRRVCVSFMLIPTACSDDQFVELGICE